MLVNRVMCILMAGTPDVERRDRNGAAGVREQIFEAATACFDRFGLRRATMDDVAAAAGVSRKTVYNYFDNKNFLISEVIEREARRVADEARARLKPGLTSRELIVEAEVSLLAAARHSSYVGMLLGPDAVALTAEVVDHSDRIAQVQRDYWYPILKPIRARGELRIDDLAELVEWLTFFHFVLVARPGTFEGDTRRTKKMLDRYLVPALLKAADQT